MERASRRTMLDRIQDVWLEPVDESLRAEIDEEKALWVLTALYSRSYEAALRSSIVDTSSMQPLSALRRSDRILELGQDPGRRSRGTITSLATLLISSIAEVHQLSALQPKAKITFITCEYGQNRGSPLASNVDIHPFSRISLLRDSSFEHIRANALASAFAAPQLKQVLQECYRVLVPGGKLELRLMDPVPDTKGTGPLLRDFIEKRLLLNLEKSFRCLRPMLLIPIWVREVGFILSENETSNANYDQISFPVVVDDAECSVEDQLACDVGRRLWQSLWGEFVEQNDGEVGCWWNDKAIAKECLQKRTTIDCRTLFASKSD
jgi:SAM-dependent methyltransferase